MCGDVVPKSESKTRGFTAYSIFCLPCNEKVNQHQRNTAQAAQEAKERKAQRSLARKANKASKANSKPVKKGKKDKKYAKDGDPSKSVFTVWSGQTPKDYGK